MTRLRTMFSNPKMFSEHFSISEEVLNEEGLIDPFLNVDTPLFIDPILLHKSENDLISGAATKKFHEHFSNLIKLLLHSHKENDASWKGAKRLVKLDEPLSNGLGYGTTERQGTSRSEEVKLQILRTMKEIVDIGSKDPDMVSLLSFFEENVGPDTISDLTTQVIEEFLAKITETFCKKHSIPTKLTEKTHNCSLPHFVNSKGVERAVLLVPKDIVRALPIAAQWSELSDAINETVKIRDSFNQYLAGVVTPTIREQKEALRNAALSSPNLLEEFIVAVKAHASNYDSNDDIFGYYKLREMLTNLPSLLKTSTKYDLSKGKEEVVKIVHESIQVFKDNVENGNLWEELWVGNTPKRERAAQLFYYAIADSFCKANNIDISPEANMGGGPVDFKFSVGYKIRVLVELKKSGGSVEHGYKKQLEIYKSAAKTNCGIFVVLDYGDSKGKIIRIKKFRELLIADGKPASDIIVIDARKKKSASKR